MDTAALVASGLTGPAIVFDPSAGQYAQALRNMQRFKGEMVGRSDPTPDREYSKMYAMRSLVGFRSDDPTQD
jgi:hypothetical protein